MVDVNRFGSLDFTLEGLGALEIRSSKRKMVVPRSFSDKHRRFIGNFIYFCFQQKESFRNSKIIF